MHLKTEIKDLVLVRAIARTGGVSRAARSLSASQSAVSHHLARIEERLGVALFERVGRGLRIAPAGERLVALADEILPRVGAFERALGDRTTQSLRIATQCYTAYRWFPELTAMVRSNFQDVEVRIVPEATRDPLAALEEKQIDLALVHTVLDAPRPAKHRSFARKVVAEDRLALVMAPDHPLADRKRVSPRDLHPYTFYVFDSTTAELVAQSKSTFASAADAPPKVQRVPLTEALIQLVQSGQGISLLSSWMIRPYLDRGDIVTRDLRGARLRRTWRAVYDKRHKLAEPLEAVTRFLVEQRTLR